MPDQPQIRQKAAAGRDAYVAGRDLIVNVGGAGAATLGVPGLLPRDVPGFTGREGELARLVGLADGGRVVVSVIGGTAGVGKTALAVHAAHQLADEFPDGHLYADLRGYTEGQDPAQPGEVLETFLRSLGVPAEEVPAKVEERSGLLRQVLASRRVLMVLDNARTEAQVRALLPGAGRSLVLVTSRSVLPGLEADERVSLDVLTADEAVAMLAGLAGTARAAAEPEAVAEVARLCGRLPLALRIAGQLLATHPAWRVARLAQLLTGVQDRLARLSAGDMQVRAAFEVSYRQLAERDRRLFRLLGLHPGPDFTADSAAALAGTVAKVAERVLDRLAGANLVTEDATGRFSMHDLLRLYARHICRDTDSPAVRGAAEVRLVSYYTDLAGSLNACVDPFQRAPAQRAGRTMTSMRETLAIFQAERPGLLAALGLAAQRGWDLQVQLLSDNTINSLNMLHYLDDLLTVTEAALVAARRAGDRDAEGRILGHLGNACRQLRRFEEAIDCYQRALAICRETGDRDGGGMALIGLGSAHADLRRFEEAIDCYQQALAIYRETGDRHSEGMALTGLGNTHADLRRFAEAIDYHQQAIAICRETGDRHSEGMALGNLGSAHATLRRFEEAVDCYQQALAIFRETGDRHGEGVALGNLGNAYAELRQPSRAAECWREGAEALRDAGDHEQADRLEQLAAGTRPRRRWGLRRRPSS